MKYTGKLHVSAFDLDGTLLNSKKELLPSTILAIQHLKQIGVHIVLASGRHPHGIWHVAESLALTGTDSYLLGFNGGAIVSLKNGRRIFDQPMKQETAWTVADAALSLGLSPVTYTESEILCLDDTNEYVLFEAGLSRLPVRQISSFRKEVSFPVNKVLVVGEPEQIAAEGESGLRDAVKGLCTVSQSAPYFLEIMPEGIDKAFGLEKLLTVLGLSRENLAAFGDGMNDKPMLDYAAVGIAMENGAPALKADADLVTGSCDENGIAHAIERLWGTGP